MSQSREEKKGSEFSSIRLVVGLGNPGDAYAHTYHNIGKMLISYLRDEDAPAKEEKTFSAYTYLRDALRPEKQRALMLVVPKTFMNESGIAVKHALAKYRLPPHAMVVAHDDSDIPVGSYKLSFDRGAGGHHGIESIIAAIGTKAFWRLRIGIRKKPGKVGQFVLQRITKTDNAAFQSVFAELRKKLNEKSPPCLMS